MQVVCPNCAARYAVDPLAIGPSGRTVQCGRCDHRWFEEVTAAAPIVTPIVETLAPDVVVQPQPTYTAGLPAIATPRPTVRRGRWIAAAVVMILVVGAAAIFAWREEIRNGLPGDWQAILGLDTARGSLTTPVQSGESAPLKIDLAASKIELAGGRYVVRGELVNSGRQEASIRIIKLVFHKGENVLGERVYSLAEGPVAPGERLPFSWPLDDRPEGTTNIVPTVE